MAVEPRSLTDWPGVSVLLDAGKALPLDDVRRILLGEGAEGWVRKRSAQNSEVFVGEHWVFKRVHFPEAMASWHRTWRANKSVRRHRRVEAAMQRRGIAAPALLLALRDEQSLVLLHQRASGDTVRDLIEGLHDAGRRERLFEQLARFLAGMHNAGVYHGDLNINNILARDEGGDWQFMLIDNEQNLVLPIAIVNRAMANVVRLWAHACAFPVSEKEKTVFFDSWLGALNTRRPAATLRPALLAKLATVEQRNRAKRGGA